MTTPFWFNRMVEYWGIPLHLDLVEHTRRARLQVLQIGDFGPMFYGLADDPHVDRHWVAMPLVGVRENLAYVAELFPRLHEAGARIVAQLSLSWNYGDHETRKGLWSSWENIWTPDLLGPAPCASPGEAMEQVAGGALRSWPIPDRPYRTYSGCCCNPHWRAMLQAMVHQALSLGVDGFMAHHNFTSFCRCSYCRARILPVLGEKFSDAELKTLYGSADLAQVEDLLAPLATCPAPLRQRWDLEVQRDVHLRRKELFDELFLDFARARKPDLLLSQWYHKYDFGPNDERSLLPTPLWARDEDYIWYSQGGHKGRSAIAKGYLADMGLPSRFTHAAGNGRPFIINKYDSRRLRLSIAEAAAHGGASLAYHLPEISEAGIGRDEYYGPIIRYHRFLAERDALYHPARPYSQLALVYPRRAELEAEAESLDALKRLGRLLEDDHGWNPTWRRGENCSSPEIPEPCCPMANPTRIARCRAGKRAGPAPCTWKPAPGNPRCERSPKGSRCRSIPCPSTTSTPGSSAASGAPSAAPPGCAPMPPGTCAAAPGNPRRPRPWSSTGSTTTRTRTASSRSPCPPAPCRRNSGCLPGTRWTAWSGTTPRCANLLS
ncbi:MAG: hypothetical protein HYW07_15810 [Candidatus Latescibacteria bacterium]|nr:hypothetical protein [Candidatus Latescibacterota bacterium]